MKFVKHTILLLLVVLTTLPFKSFSQQSVLENPITISFKNETLKSALLKIEKEAGVSFTHSNFKDLNKKVSGDFPNQTLKQILKILLADTKLSFKVIGGKIILYEKEKAKRKKSNRVTIHGHIYDAESGERLINANVYNPESFIGTISNNYGFYSYSCSKGAITLTATYMGYQSETFNLDLLNDTTLNIALQVKSDQLDEVTIIGSQSNSIEETQMSMIDIPIQKLNKVPVILGESDVLKVMQLYPGIQAGLEGTSGIHVRGGSPDQNLFLIDGVPVYNASHLFGFFSTFNPYALKSVKVYKGGFPARYGGRLSSVVDVQMIDGNMKTLKGEFSIGLLSSRITLEGPIIKDKTSFMISARRTYTDLFAQPINAFLNKKNESENNYKLYFYDLNAKLNHIISPRSRLYWSMYKGQDNFYLKEVSRSPDFVSTNPSVNTSEGGIGWSNLVSSIRWNYLINNKLFSNTTVSYSKFSSDILLNNSTEYINDKLTTEDFSKYLSGIKDITIKSDFDYFLSNKQILKFGIAATRHEFTPGVTNSRTKEENNSRVNIKANELKAYIEDEFSFSRKLKINYGLHVSLFNVENTNYIRPQPRIIANYKLSDKLAFKASASRMAQYLHLLDFSELELPFDIWVPVTAKFEPPICDQYAIGTSIVIPNNFQLKLEGFYKNYLNLIENKEGASFSAGGKFWENNVEKGRGWAYGAEVLLEKKEGKTTGFLGYTLSKSERQFNNINFGQPFPYKYDRRHDFSIVINHEFNEHIDLNATWIYSTGRAATIALTKYPVTGIPDDDSYIYYVNNYNGRNGNRFPTYHRLDLGVNLKKVKKYGLRTWSFSLYNTYSRMNAFSLNWRTDYNIQFMNENGVSVSSPKLYILSIFPIIPSISYALKF